MQPREFIHVTTGTGNRTISYGVWCPRCGKTQVITTEFHGYWARFCATCGDEL